MAWSQNPPPYNAWRITQAGVAESTQVGRLPAILRFMWPHFTSLLSHSWDSLGSPLDTLGFTLLVALILVGIHSFYDLWKHGNERLLLKPFTSMPVVAFLILGVFLLE
jgi:hypothetical protein